LNELSNEPHNVWIKCFASQKKVKKQVLDEMSCYPISSQLIGWRDSLFAPNLQGLPNLEGFYRMETKARSNDKPT